MNAHNDAGQFTIALPAERDASSQVESDLSLLRSNLAILVLVVGGAATLAYWALLMWAANWLLGVV